MRDPSAQQLFDQTVAFLNKQGGRSTMWRGSQAAYFGENNRRCAVGMYIPRRFYDKWKVEGKGLADLFMNEALMAERGWFWRYEHLLRSLMYAHDPNQAKNDHGEFSPALATPIVNRLRLVARRHQLDDSIIDRLVWPELWM